MVDSSRPSARAVVASALALIVFCWGAPAAAQEARSDSSQHSVAAASEPVITLRGACGERPEVGAHDMDCNQTLSREAFESLLSALNPGGRQVSPEARRNLAIAYAELVAFEAGARKAGLEDTAQFHELMSWVRLRTVADLYRRGLQEKYSSPSADEIDAYYREHPASFEQVHLARILVPRTQAFSAVGEEEFEKQAAAAARMAHERAARSEDPARIQQDVNELLGVQAAAATDMGMYRRSELVENEREAVFSLQPGEVSQVVTEPKSYVIYKVLSKGRVPQERVKAQIAHDISQEGFTHALQAAIDSAHAQFNEAYFGGPVTVPVPTVTPSLPARSAGH